MIVDTLLHTWSECVYNCFRFNLACTGKNERKKDIYAERKKNDGKSSNKRGYKHFFALVFRVDRVYVRARDSLFVLFSYNHSR